MADGAAPALGAGYEITLTRTFSAPPEVVFDCFTDAEKLARWWGPLGTKNTVRAWEARPGGTIDLTMSGPGFDHPMGGEFVEVERPRRLVFLSKAFEGADGEWGLVNRNTLTFEATGAGSTRLTLAARVERAEGAMVAMALGGMKTGWGQSLERLGDAVGGGGKVDLEVKDKLVIVTRAFDAPREQVWRALTDAEALARWWCAGECTVEALDLRPGGKWAIRQTGADGQSHLFWGEYLQIEPPTRVAMTQGFDSYPPIEVEHLLSEEWGRTVLTRVMTFPDNAYRDGMMGSGFEPGVAAAYDALARLLAGKAEA